MEIDSILDKLGRIGKFQILMYVFCGLQGISFPVWDMLSVTSFMAPSPEYSCVSSQSEDENGGKYMERVAFNHSVYSGECEDGEEIVFNLDTYGRTLVTEWKLVGDEAVLVELSQSLFMVGMMVGSIVLGQMSDSFGRKPILIMCASLSPLLGLASGFVPNMWFFIAIRILIGFICPGAILSSYVLALELFPSKKRAAASILLSSFNAIAYVSLATLAFFIKDWRYLQISTSAFRILLVPFCLFVPESIQWLAAKGKHEKLEQLLQKIATINKIDLAFPILADINKSDQTDGTTYNHELSTSDSDLPLKESDKADDERLFMYDSAVSLDDRDYIPAEDNYSLDNYSSDSETEEAAHSASGYLSVSRSSSSNLAAHRPRNGLSYPGHCERVNLYPVNSSISILSELREESELLASYDDLYQQRPPGAQIPYLPKKTLERSQEPHTNKPLRKKSISLCHIPSFVTFESEIRRGDGVVGNKLSADHRMKEKSNVMKTVSIPNITVNPSEGTAVPGIEAACPPDRGAVHGSKVNRKPANLTITTNEDAGSSFLLSVPTLALPFGYSQNLFPNAGNQYGENVESSQSEEEEGWIRDDTSGFNSSTSNVGHLSDYESLEEGYGKKQGKDGYSELKKSAKADNKTVKKEKAKKAYTALDLFRMSSVRLITVSSMTIWFATYSVYVGLSMSTDALAGDPYINFSLVGLVEIPAVIVAALSAVRIGRRFPSGVFHFLTALSCCVYLVLPIENDSTWSSMISVVAILFAKCFTSAAYNVECLLTAEVLPTPLRSVGIGLFVLCSRIGGVIVPFILLSGESWSKYPMMIFAALSVLASLMLLPLPEMMGMPQPQTPDDVKRIRKISRERKASKAQPAIIDV